MQHLDIECREAVGISAAQLTALLYLKRRPDCLMKELANGLMLDNSAVSSLVKRMEKSGLVVRQVDSSDRRAYHLVLTDHGYQCIKLGRPLLELYNQSIERDFNEQELVTVKRYLCHLVNNYKR